MIDDGTREQESLHLPVMRELDSRLIGLDQCEDVIFRAIEDTFENSEIAHHACEFIENEKYSQQKLKKERKKKKSMQRTEVNPPPVLKFLLP